MSLRFSPVAAAVAMTVSAAAQSADIGEMFSVRGYGTLGVAYSSEDNADFISTSTQPQGVGYSDNVTFDVDSRTALQIDARFTERLSGVVQIISESNYNNTWDGDPNERYHPSLEWANLSYKVTDNITLRGGRIVLPFLAVSDYRKVGFANHWLRPPVEVYGAIPFTTSDGGEATWRANVGSGINTLRAHYGEQTLRGGGVDAQSEIAGVNNTFERGSLSVRAAWMRAEFVALYPITVFDSLANLLTLSGAPTAREAARMAQQYNPVNEQSVDVYDVGATYDPGKWFVMGEVMVIDSDGIVPSSTGGYVSGGWRWNAFTPYATYSMRDAKDRDEVQMPGVAPTQIPAPFRGAVMGLSAAANGILGGDSSQQTLSLGVRWDFYKNFDLKVQYDYVDPEFSGTLINVQPGFEMGSNVNVVSVAVDFVF